MPTNMDNENIFPNLPNVPADLPDDPHGSIGSSSGHNQQPKDDEIDFDDLSRRFLELTKKK